MSDADDICGLARERAARALASGALVVLSSERVALEDDGVPFVARLLVREDEKRSHAARRRSAGENPFLPYDPELFVCDLPPSHVCLLNRFMVVPGHLLIVTAEFREQEEPLERADFDALYQVLRQSDGLGFYNAGLAAGASQHHKHLQLVPTPLGEGPERFPTEPLLREAADAGGSCERLPFAHVAERIPAPDGSAALAVYRDLRARLGLAPRDPYNLLATLDLMVLIPRVRETWDGCSINALGFAGALLVRTPDQLTRLRTEGPLTALASLTR